MKLILSNDIEIQKAPKELLEKIRQRLTMFNPKWFENERMGYLNRGVPKVLQYFMEDKISFAVPRGFYSELISMCDKKPDILDLRSVQKPVSFTFNTEERPYQDEAIAIMLCHDQGVLQAPTGSGKTIMALSIIAARRQPTLIIVHTKELLYQWKDRIETFLSIPKEDIGQIGDGKKTVGKKITVAMVQTLFKCADKVAPKIGHLVVDETHRVVSRCFDEAVSYFDCKYFLGLSATPFRRDKLTNLIWWFIGPKIHEIRIEEMIEKKAILPIDVIMRQSLFKTNYDPINQYSLMIKELTEDEERNKLIINDAAEEAYNGVALILSDRKTHCLTLQTMLSEKGIESVLLTGDCSSQERKQIIERIGQNKERIVIATGQLIGEGFDCKNLSSLFLSTPIRFSGRLLQYLGRVLRPAKGKEKAMIYDYVDIHIRQLVNSAKERARIYRKEFNCDEELFRSKEERPKAMYNRRS
ncbi:hypothetical protein A2619_01170 [candidate division WWE3 bacterium RIFOXYD1_FULL_39_9]|uniref:Helicase n=1 Tax=candidate division WWE3 bacterium RIFOXYD1_FULL_39_9 TaxID=1802649 RepID=A0A1F4X677_UNCKA|nr:MAG: hypothetical protein A2619_01170 [candidate division WWE3 bacterium RIFOXYD1_FULL_39_9]